MGGQENKVGGSKKNKVEGQKNMGSKNKGPNPESQDTSELFHVQLPHVPHGFASDHDVIDKRHSTGMFPVSDTAPFLGRVF